jgi:anion-transporting  ArsA/GET3 family ATPase
VAALAEDLLRDGLRVLVAACDVKERLSAYLAVPALDGHVRELRPHLYGVRLEPERAMREYGELKLRNRLLAAAIFESRQLRAFLGGVPGLPEWAMLGKAWFHSQERTRDGSARFDVVIVDAPATGHGVDMLRVPRVILDLVPPGPLRADAERAWATFSDPRSTAIVLVSLPEELPVTETLELHRSLTVELQLPVARIVLNGTVEPLLAGPGTKGAREPAAPGSLADILGRRSAREQAQAESELRLAPLGVPLSRLPRLSRGVRGPEDIRRLAGSLRSADAPPAGA